MADSKRTESPFEFPYCTVPAHELETRIKRFQKRLQDAGIDLALIRQNADLYYLAGSVQDGHLLVPAEGKPLFLVWRVHDRALRESPHLEVRRIESFSDLSDWAASFSPTGRRGSLGLELDVLPASLYLHYTRRLWPGWRVEDVSPVIREMRRLKSPWEISCIEEACRQARQAMDRVGEVLAEGMTELELTAEVESVMRRLGHPGLLRMRLWNHEMGMGQVVSGPSGAVAAWTLTPVGGTGPAAAFGMGAGHRRISAHEPVSVDLGGWHCGYCCDQTRVFCIGEPPRQMEDAFRFVSEVMTALQDELRPGVPAGRLYDLAMNMAEEAGVAQGFMGLGKEKVRFIGHGLGIELDEFPFLSRGNEMILEPGMVVALEPKLVSDTGVIGLEDTFLIEETCARRLTLGPQELAIISC